MGRRNVWIALAVFATAGIAWGAWRLASRASLVGKLIKSGAVELDADSQARAQWLASQRWIPERAAAWWHAAMAQPKKLTVGPSITPETSLEVASERWPKLESMTVHASGPSQSVRIPEHAPALRRVTFMNAFPRQLAAGPPALSVTSADLYGAGVFEWAQALSTRFPELRAANLKDREGELSIGLWRALGRLRHLEELELAIEPEDDLRPLATLRGLKRLDLQLSPRASFHAAAFAALAELDGLESFDLPAKYDVAALQRFGLPRGLKSLTVPSNDPNGPNPEWFPDLRPLPFLQELTFTGRGESRSYLDVFETSGDVEQGDRRMRFRTPGNIDAAGAVIRGSRRLERFYAAEGWCGPAFFAALRDHPSLAELGVECAELDEEGARALLSAPGITDVRFEWCLASEATIRALEDGIGRRGGSFRFGQAYDRRARPVWPRQVLEEMKASERK